MTIAVSGLEPSGSFAMLVGDDLGSDAVPGGVCGGTVTGLSGSSLVLRNRAGIDGGRVYTPEIDELNCGRYAQVVDLETCTVSEAVRLGGPTGVPCDDMDAFVTTQADVDAIAECSTLGSLFVLPSEPLEVSLPLLERVSGFLEVMETGLDAPLLTEVGAGLVFAGFSPWGEGMVEPVAVNLPRLESAFDLAVIDVATEAIHLPAFRSVGVVFVWASALPSITLPSLVDAVSIEIYDSVGLESVDLSSLETADDIMIYGSPDLTDLQLTSVVTAGSLTVQANPLLSELALPELSSVTYLYVGENAPDLCFTPALDTSIADSYTVEGDAACWF